MSLESVRVLLSSEFDTWMATYYPAVEIQFENQRQPEHSPIVTWAEFSIKPMTAKQASIGTARRYARYNEALVIEFHAAEKTGTKQTNELRQAWGDFIENRKFTVSDGEYIKMGMARYGAYTLNNGRYTAYVIVDYLREACKEAPVT